MSLPYIHTRGDGGSRELYGVTILLLSSDDDICAGCAGLCQSSLNSCGCNFIATSSHLTNMRRETGSETNDKYYESLFIQLWLLLEVS